MDDRDEMLLAALTGLLDAKFAQFKVEMREEMHGMKKELQEEMYGMKKELQEEMHGIKKELQGEIQEVKEEVKGLKQEVKEIKEELKDVKDMLYHDTVRLDDFNKLKKEVEELKKSS